jgi:hypothetical protein
MATNVYIVVMVDDYLTDRTYDSPEYMYYTLDEAVAKLTELYLKDDHEWFIDCYERLDNGRLILNDTLWSRDLC